MSGNISGIESRVVSSAVPETKRTRSDRSERSAAAGTTERMERTRAPVVEKTIRKAYPKAERSRASEEFRRNTLEKAIEKRKKQALNSGFSLEFEFLWETGEREDGENPSLNVFVSQNEKEMENGMVHARRTVVRVVPAADIERFVALAVEGEPSGGLFEMFF